MNISSLTRALYAAAVVVGIMLRMQAAEAQNITWGTPTTASADSDVQTNGTLFLAYTLGYPTPPNVTVNGILFSAFDAPGIASVTDGNLTLSTTGATVNGHTGIFGSGAAPFANLSSAYQTLLGSDANTTTLSTATPLTVTIGGLTVGQTYQVEFWVNDARPGITRSETISGGPTLSFHLPANGADGGVGQFVIGTWTATSTTQSFVVTGTPGSSVSQINAIEVLALNLSAVITTVSPNSVPFGGPSTILTVYGSGFLPGATVLWNGAKLTTTYVSSTQLTAQLTTNNSLVPTPAAVTVVNPGIAASNAYDVTVLQPSIQVTYTISRVAGTNQVLVTATFTNSGGGYALNATLTQATLGGVAPLSPALPTPPGIFNPGSSTIIPLLYPASIPPGLSVLKLTGTYTAGKFSAAYRATVP